MSNLRRLVAATLLSAFALAAWAQEAYPSRPVAVVVPFPPGGVADTALRALQPSLQRSLGQPVVISNYASSGNYGPSLLPAAMLADAAGVRFNHIPYTGGAQMISSLLGGQVDFAVFSRSQQSKDIIRKIGRIE
ncbi:tripartite tricarboxylate transporter substrate-binding protein [Variovorax sp.]|uniref:tripartite tricarboxylate transporter substrate-binding protein n=1 Tax=Variovorax sp. TaxID=1871043 RepID=UPI002D5C0013|nr:tripartite tricarboxylate transporter substrate-binding protein [Variovorax sp.]HYP82329.1 tripartite tricarboxylate transporter substrate-binding protein [Variovorax sp.]